MAERRNAELGFHAQTLPPPHHGEFWVTGTSQLSNPAESQLGSATKRHQKATGKRYRSEKTLGDFGELERMKSWEFRSDVSLTRHDSSQQGQNLGRFCRREFRFPPGLTERSSHGAGKSRQLSGPSAAPRAAALAQHGRASQVIFRNTRPRRAFWRWMRQPSASSSRTTGGEVLSFGFISLSRTKVPTSNRLRARE